MLGIQYPLSNAAAYRIKTISALTVFILLCLGGVLSSQAYGAVVYTDRADYPPGDSVVITGAGFWSGEPVRLWVTHVDGATPMTPDYEPWEIPANSYGNFETYWIVPEDALGSTLQITAAGQTSGLIATTTFTDASDPDFHERLRYAVSGNARERLRGIIRELPRRQFRSSGEPNGYFLRQ